MPIQEKLLKKSSENQVITSEKIPLRKLKKYYKNH